MTRAIAIIICLIANLFLVPVQGDCSEIPEYESETEIECCIAVNSPALSQVDEKQSKSLQAPYYERHHVCVTFKIQVHIINLPARILNCVFRE